MDTVQISNHFDFEAKDMFNNIFDDSENWGNDSIHDVKNINYGFMFIHLALNLSNWR